VTLPSSRISPTAFYTGAVWLRNGLSDRAFHTVIGSALYAAMWPVNRLSAAFGGASLEEMLTARHRVIDNQLGQSIESGEISQVIEIAAGLSPRGLRFVRSYPRLTYVEADLAPMAARKRAVLARVGKPVDRHVVVDVDAFAETGPMSVASVCQRSLEPSQGTALITEGLIDYFDTSSVIRLWNTFSSVLGVFPAGLYLADLHFESDLRKVLGSALFRRALNRITRGQQHVYFQNALEAKRALINSGFDNVEIPYASDVADAPLELGRSTRQRTSRIRIVIARTHT